MKTKPLGDLITLPHRAVLKGGIGVGEMAKMGLAKLGGGQGSISQGRTLFERERVTKRCGGGKGEREEKRKGRERRGKEKGERKEKE